MPTHPALDQPLSRRHTIAEKPFAGRIGGFQQDFEDDEQGREILKSQPDAVGSVHATLTIHELLTSFNTSGSALLAPRRTTPIGIPGLRELENGHS
jgi:hypothetical protein